MTRIMMHVHVLLWKLRVMVLMFSIPHRFIGSMFFALAVGYNELARQQQEVKRKALCRMMRESTQRSMLALGLIKERLPFHGNPIVLEIILNRAVPNLEFRESDWELMREALARYDADRSGK